MDPQPKRSSIVDSPWYWIYVFCAAALIALIVIGPKFARRQTLDERNYQARQRANQAALGQEPDVPLSTEDNRIITLTPLFLIVAVVFTVAWAIVWWSHLGRRWFHRTAGTRETTP